MTDILANGLTYGSLTPAWYVVQCKPRQDVRALENLKNQGIECFRPIIPRERILRGRKVVANESLFPGYFFISLDRESLGWSRIRSTRGVSRLLAFGGRPVAIDSRVLEIVRHRAEDNSKSVDTFYRPGSLVKIIKGPLRTLDAIFQAYDGEARAFLLIEFLSQLSEVNLPITDFVLSGNSH